MFGWDILCGIWKFKSSWAFLKQSPEVFFTLSFCCKVIILYIYIYMLCNVIIFFFHANSIGRIWGDMMMSSNGNIFCITGLCEGNPPVTGRSPLIKASYAERWCFLWSMPEQTLEQTIEMPVIWRTMVFIMTLLQCIGIALYICLFSAIRKRLTPVR